MGPKDCELQLMYLPFWLSLGCRLAVAWAVGRRLGSVRSRWVLIQFQVFSPGKCPKSPELGLVKSEMNSAPSEQGGNHAETIDSPSVGSIRRQLGSVWCRMGFVGGGWGGHLPPPPPTDTQPTLTANWDQAQICAFGLCGAPPGKWQMQNSGRHHDRPPPSAPPRGNEKYWTEEVLDRRASGPLTGLDRP